MKVETYIINGWMEPITGAVIKEDKNWILTHLIPTDYVIDGYTLINKSHIEKRFSKESEKQIAEVLKLKKFKVKIGNKFNFGSIKKMSKWIEKNYGLIQFQEKNEYSLEIGLVERIKKNSLSLLFLKPNGKFKTKYTFEYDLDEIRTITFDTDYLNSLGLLAMSKVK